MQETSILRQWPRYQVFWKLLRPKKPCSSLRMKRSESCRFNFLWCLTIAIIIVIYCSNVKYSKNIASINNDSADAAPRNSLQPDCRQFEAALKNNRLSKKKNPN